MTQDERRLWVRTAVIIAVMLLLMAMTAGLATVFVPCWKKGDCPARPELAPTAAPELAPMGS